MAEPSWPFLAVLMSETPAIAKGGAPEPARVRGLGLVDGGAVVAPTHVAERATVALLPDGSQVAARAARYAEAGLTLVQLASPWGPVPGLSDAAAGQDVTVALVSDYAPDVRLVAGRVRTPEPDGRFTVDLDGRLAEDETASGSPVLGGDGAVVGIVGPTATGSSVDAFGAAAIRQLLSPSPEPEPGYDLAGGISSDLVDPTRGIPLERDRLGLGVDVTMLAALVADVDTPMPLSIGLFGEWGSGKSYFMGMLRSEIARLAASADPRYHGDVVQIGFNAWHYADTNLWASLGDEIFEQLAGPQGEDTDARRGRLRAELADRLERRRELHAAALLAHAETERLTTELDDARSTRRATARELAGAVLQSDELRGQLEPAFKRLGLGGADERIEALADELERAPEDASMVRDAVGGVPWWAWIAGLVVAAAVAAGVAVAWDEVAGIVAAVPAVLAVAGAIIARVRSGGRLLHDVAEGIRRRQEERITPKLTELKLAEANERVLQTQLDQVARQADDLGRELAELTPGRRLYGFVAERAASDAYRGQLGLISTIRKDFEQLIELMDRWRAEGGADGDGAKRPIDRIVLYIDDLDRCSPEQVVEVLQAVHLLLALDLFVVVVGVDPRWLLHSLSREYRTLLTARTPGSDQDPRWATTPQDYLEKIFNIPFVLPRMTPDSFAKLISGLAATTPDDASAADGRAEAAEQPQSRPAETATAATPAERGSEVVQLQEGAATVDRRPLTDDELRMLSALAPLVETPREAKRLMNLYRMMRSTRDLSSVSRFLGNDGNPGEYQAVVILLGLLSGHARLLHDVLAGLRARPSSETWAQFAGGLRPRANGGGFVNDVVGDIPGGDVEQWRRLSDGLENVTALTTLRDLEAFQLWAPRIARFSFLLSPYAESHGQPAR